MTVLFEQAASAARFDRFISRQFATVVLQPTTLCPWDCDYCYLPSRNQNLGMSLRIAEAVAASIEAQDSPHPVEVVWHGGEPLALGVERMRSLLAPFEALNRVDKVRHAVQTGGGLITPTWCELFVEHGFAVGVSIDGPAWADSARHDRSGRPVHERIMKGIRTLSAHGVRFTAIAVVTRATVGQPDEIAGFFESLGAESVGFNLEEYEGANTGRLGIDAEAARAFWRALLRRRAEGSALRVRDVDRFVSFLRAEREGAPNDGSALYVSCDRGSSSVGRR